LAISLGTFVVIDVGGITRTPPEAEAAGLNPETS
jgi:hypothetical protein